jgi:hypothetical protein
MKKLILFSLIVLSNLTYGQNFPGTSVDLLVGKELKVIEKDVVLQKFGYSDFYTNDSLNTHYDCCETVANSKYKTLAGKVFKLISFEPYTDATGTEKFKLKIENSETGVVFYNYDPRFEHLFAFEVVGGIEYPEDYFCKNIVESRDKFSGEFSYSSPFSTIEFNKLIKGNTARTQMSLRVFGDRLVLNTKGITILLENGFRIEKPDVKIIVSAIKSTSGYTYSAFFDLTENDIKLLSANMITDYRLYMFDGVPASGKLLMEYLKCLSNK